MRGNGTLGQLVRAKLGTVGGDGGVNSSGSCIPSAHQAISGAGQRRDKTGTDKKGSENKETRLGQDSQMERKVKEK